MNAPLPMKVNLVNKFADRFSLDHEKVLPILKSTAFKVKDGTVSDEQMMALLVVAEQYGLNPFTKELYAFPDKQNGIVPVVSVDGWSRIINEHGSLDGIEFRYADKLETPNGGKSCPEWCEVIIHRKDRKQPTVIREYLDEVYRAPFKGRDGYEVKGPWQSHTKRFLRHKTLIQGARIAFGFGGIYDEDEAIRIIDADHGTTIEGTATKVEQPQTVAETAKTHKEPEPPQKEPVATAADTDKAGPMDDKPMAEGQKNVLRAKLRNAGLNDIDLSAKFGRKLGQKGDAATAETEGWKFSDFNAVDAWIASKASNA